MPVSIDLEADNARLHAFFEETQPLLALPDDRLFEAEPSVSDWSVAQQLYHSWIATGKSLKVIQLIQEGAPIVSREGEPTKAGYQVLTQERIVRGRAKASPRVRPPEVLTRDDLQTTLHRSRKKHAELEPLLPLLPALKGRVPHPLLGYYNAAEWFRFIRIHAWHHLAIIQDILDLKEQGRTHEHQEPEATDRS